MSANLPNHPTLYVDGISSISETGLRPHIITGIFLQLIREHFINADRIDSPYLKTLLWVHKEGDPVTPDPARSKILIDPVYRWNLKETQRRPAVLVKRNEMQPQNIGLAHSRTFGLGDRDFPEAGSKHSLFFVGSHTFFCVATDGGAVETLSTEVARHLYQFAPIITREFCFLTLEIAQIGEVTVLEESSEHFTVPIVMRYSYEDKWLLTKQEPRFKGVSVEIGTGE